MNDDLSNNDDNESVSSELPTQNLRSEMPPVEPTAESNLPEAVELEATVSLPGHKQPRLGDQVRYFGDYELLEEIARGGMGVVYRAKQSRLNRIVALKMILSGQFSSEDDVQRFHREAEAAAQLDHPNIVPIFEVGEHKRQHYFSMAFVEGESLAQRVAKSPLPPSEAAKILKIISQAIAYAHSKGVIHRDLKPANVILGIEGETQEPAPIKRTELVSKDFDARAEIRPTFLKPKIKPKVKRQSARSIASATVKQNANTYRDAYTPKVTDFGLAKRTTEDQGITATGQILGTPSYMPPEQAEGKLAEVKETADIYSLGAILYCLLTGRPPFQAATPLDTLLQVLNQVPVPPRQINSSIPLDLQTICLKCLEKSPQKRYQSAHEVAAELGRVQRGEPIQARPISLIAKLGRWSWRKPVLASLIAVIFIGLFLAIRLTATNSRLHEQTIQLEEQQALAQRQTRIAKQLSEINTRRAELTPHAVRLHHAWDAWHSGDLKLANSILDESERKDLAYFAMRRVCDPRLASTPVKDDITSLSWSNDGEMILAGWGGTADIYSANSLHSMLRQKGRDTREDTIACWSPDSKLVATYEKGTPSASIWQAGTGEKVFEIPCSGSLAWSPHGVRLATGETTVWNIATRVKELEIEQGCQEVAWSPDGQLLLGKVGSTLILWDSSSGEQIVESPGFASFHKMTWRPTGNALAATSRGGAIQVYDISRTKNFDMRFRLTNGCVDMGWSPDGSKLATVSGFESNTGEVVVRRPFSAEELFSFRTNSVPQRLDWSPDGTKIATYSRGNERRLDIWSAEPPKQYREMVAVPAGNHSVSWSPDGRYFVTANTNKRGTAGVYAFTVWSADGQEKFTRSLESFPLEIRWSPDGDAILIAFASNKASYFTVHNAQNGDEILSTEPCSRSFDSVCWSPDGKLFAAVHQHRRKCELVIWDAQTGGAVRSLWSSESLFGLSWSPDGTMLAAGTGDGNEFKGGVLVLDVSTGKQRCKLTGHTFGTLCVAWSPDGKTIASGSSDNTIKIWDVEDERLLQTLRGHEERVYDHWIHDGVYDLCFSPDGDYIVSASADNTLKIWDTGCGLEMLTLIGDDGVNSVVWSPDGNSLLTESFDGMVRIWDVSTPLEPETNQSNGGSDTDFIANPLIVKSVATNQAVPDSELVDHAFKIERAVLAWRRQDALTVEKVLSECGIKDLAFHHVRRLSRQRIDDPQHRRGDQSDKVLNGHIGPVYSVDWDSSGERIVSGGGFSRSKNEGHGLFTPEGVLIVQTRRKIVDSAGDVRIWNGSTGELLHTLEQDGCVESVAWRPGSEHVALGTRRKDTTNFGGARFWVWDVATKTILEPKGNRGHWTFPCLNWTDSGSGLAVVRGDSISVYNGVYDKTGGFSTRFLPGAIESVSVRVVDWGSERALRECLLLVVVARCLFSRRLEKNWGSIPAKSGELNSALTASKS